MLHQTDSALQKQCTSTIKLCRSTIIIMPIDINCVGKSRKCVVFLKKFHLCIHSQASMHSGAGDERYAHESLLERASRRTSHGCIVRASRIQVGFMLDVMNEHMHLDNPAALHCFVSIIKKNCSFTYSISIVSFSPTHNMVAL